jgi:hypothetical protein
MLPPETITTYGSHISLQVRVSMHVFLESLDGHFAMPIENLRFMGYE